MHFFLISKQSKKEMYGVPVNICIRQPISLGELITDMNLMLTGGDESKMTFLYHVK